MDAPAMLGAVNFLGHAAMALASGRDDPSFVLGAMLPDLAGIAGVRVRREDLGEDLATGVQCHLATDTAFHAHPLFRRGQADLRTALLAAGLASGPARAIGHIGWELLLDGCLVGSAAEAAYRQAVGRGEDVVAALSEQDWPRWAVFLGHRDRRPRLRYDEPEWVAERVYGALAHRPRLRLPRAQVPVVAAILAQHQSGVVQSAGPVLEQVAMRVRSPFTAGT